MEVCRGGSLGLCRSQPQVHPYSLCYSQDSLLLMHYSSRPRTGAGRGHSLPRGASRSGRKEGSCSQLAPLSTPQRMCRVWDRGLCERDWRQKGTPGLKGRRSPAGRSIVIMTASSIITTVVVKVGYRYRSSRLASDCSSCEY